MEPLHTHLAFVPLKEEDLEWARLLHNDPDVLRMLTDPHEVTPEEQELWFRVLQKSKSSRREVLWAGRRKAGVARMDQIDRHNKSICLGMDIHKDFRGQGLATPAYKLLLKSLFCDEGFNRVWLLVAEYNTRARHIYTKLGFIEEGKQREGLLKEGRYRDYIMMSILRSEYHE